MTDRDFKVGDVVTIKGQGEVILVENCDLDGDAIPEECVWRCYGHGPQKCSYWVRQKDIVGKTSKEVLQIRQQEARARKVDCNYPDCWCREYLS